MKKLMIKQRLEGGEGISHVNIWGKNSWTCQCKGPEVGEDLESVRKHEEASVAVAVCERVRVVIEVSGG